MEIVPGGYVNVIVADNAAFVDYMVVDKILKRGTSIVPSTDVEEGSDNDILGTTKKLSVDVNSANNDDALYEFLSDAEEARTPIYLRFFLMHPHYYFDVIATLITVDRDLVEVGKYNGVSISGTRSADRESDLFELVYMFNPFNPENL